MITLPQQRTPTESVLSAMRELREHDTQWQRGRTWSLVYDAGDDGLADTVTKTTVRLRDGIESIQGLRDLGDPVMSILAIGSNDLNVFEVGDELTLRGWNLDRQQLPSSLHLTVTSAHARVCEKFLDDLRESVSAVKRPSASRLAHSMAVRLARTAANVLPAKLASDLTARSSAALGLGEAQVPARSAAVYGMMASLPNRGDIDKLVLDLLEQPSRPQEEPTAPQGQGTE